MGRALSRQIHSPRIGSVSSRPRGRRRGLVLLCVILLIIYAVSRRSEVPTSKILASAAKQAQYYLRDERHADGDEGFFDIFDSKNGGRAAGRDDSAMQRVEEEKVKEPVKRRRRPKPDLDKMLQSKEVDLARKDGRVLIPRSTSGQTRRHPIPLLMLDAERKWDQLRKRQSKTFKQAVAEYKKRNGRNPPGGFDRWYAFCREYDVKMIDEYALIDDAIRPFFALSPKNFRQRVEYVSKWNIVAFGWGLEVKDGQVRAFGRDKDCSRARGTLELMERFASELPDFKSWHTAADGPHIWLSGDERLRLEDLAKKGQFDEREDEDPDYLSKAYTPPINPMAQTCLPGTAMREEGFDYGVAQNDTRMPSLPDDASAAFVVDVRAALDICRNPHIRHTHSAISWTFPLPGPHLPLFSPGVHGHFADLPSIITEQFNPDEHDDTPWSDRTDSRLLFRGQTSGPNWLRQWPWKSSHRARLHLIAQDGIGTPASVHLDAVNGSGVYELAVPAPVLNAAFLDVGMVGPAVQCDVEDGTCDEMTRVFKGYKDRISIQDSRRYKFEIDARIIRLAVLSHSDRAAVVFKATIFPAFWTDWAVPWLHYVPISVDYSDLWDSLAYFRGGLYGEDAHDEEAKIIAEAGQRFAEDYLRWNDMEAFQFRLMLEYARLYSLDRKADGTGGEYEGDGSEEPSWG